MPRQLTTQNVKLFLKNAFVKLTTVAEAFFYWMNIVFESQKNTILLVLKEH